MTVAPECDPDIPLDNAGCLYKLQQTPFFLMGSLKCKLVQLEYRYTDNESSIKVWKNVLDDLIYSKEIISYKFIPEQQPNLFLVEYPQPRSSKASIS